MAELDLNHPDLYINRELSWLDFNYRVLEEALDDSNPLLERVKFLAIVTSNLDEFFEVRVAGLLQISETGGGPTGPDGLTPDEQLEQIATKAHSLVDHQYRCWNEDLLPALDAEGIHLIEARRLKEDNYVLRQEHSAFLDHYWREELEPILTPIVIDPSHPFPRVLNKALCIGVHLRDEHHTFLGVVTVPRVLPRILQLPSPTDNEYYFITMAGIIQHFISDLFSGYELLGSAPFRVTRNSDLYVNEEEADNLLEEIAEQVKNRRKADVVRLEISSTAPESLTRLLESQFDLPAEQLYYVNGPVNLNRVMTLYGSVNRPDLKDRPFSPVDLGLPRDPDDFFAKIRDRDVMIHHPYESFSAVTQFIRMAAADPKVLAIKQTLYRTGDDSEVVQALIGAASQGKEVTVLVELKARGDEATNIDWARRLEESGVHVIYGLMGMKTHCKLCMLVRRDDNHLRRYAHLGTGNYNHITARLYTDLGLFTARPDITQEVADVFNLLTARTQAPRFNKLLVAPSTLIKGIVKRIDREIDHARAGQPAAIIAKMNGLLDPIVVESLFRASQAGVQIDLIVRGVCNLRPGVPGVSDNIRVYSIIGRFLEHSRVFYFSNAGTPDILLGSADWMNRNLRGRVEVVFPVEDESLKLRVYRELLVLGLLDRVKSRQLQSDGTYVRLTPSEHTGPLCQQEMLMDIALGQDVEIPSLAPAPSPRTGDDTP
jgi:polyphosphate kinase